MAVSNLQPETGELVILNKYPKKDILMELRSYMLETSRLWHRIGLLLAQDVSGNMAWQVLCYDYYQHMQSCKGGH